MAKTFCIPRHLAEKFKASDLAKDTDIKKLMSMTSKERREFLSTRTNPELGKFINTEFEKAVVSKQKDALKQWAVGVFSPQEQKTARFKTVMDKIEALDKAGVLGDQKKTAFLEDLISDKLGLGVTGEEAKQIHTYATKIRQVQKKLGDNFGDVVNHYEDNLEFLKARKEMDDLLDGFSPSSKTKVLSGTIGRASMLTSIKSPVLNIGSNTVNGILEATQRRLARGEFKGADSKLAMDYIKKVNKIYQATGYDISRAMTDDFGSSGARILGDKVSAKGVGGITGKVGRAAEDIVFKQLMGAPDVAFSSAHFADSVNLGANKLAKGNKDVARKMMLDAMRLDPITDAGKALKAQGVVDAQFSTYTNNSTISKASEGVRKVLNDIVPDARIGDWVMPFVKTPANVLNASLDYGGLGAVKGIYKMGKMIANKNITKAGIREASSDIVRSGMGFAGALMIANQLGDDDFVGAYDPARKQIEALRNSNTNSIRIGDKWISLDWLGPLGAPLTGILYAKKYGKEKGTKPLAYAKGVARQLTTAPGLEELNNFYDTLSKKEGEMSKEEMGKELQKTAFDQLYGRLIPSFVGDIAKASDTYEREAKTTGEKIKSRLPYLRETLPVKKNVFAEPIKGESAFTDIVFGARVKTNKEDETIKKINTLVDRTGKNLSITDWSTTTGKQINELKSKVGNDTFNQMKDDYGRQMKEELKTLMSSTKYQISDDLAKINMINSLDDKIIKKVFNSKGLKYK